VYCEAVTIGKLFASSQTGILTNISRYLELNMIIITACILGYTLYLGAK